METRRYIPTSGLNPSSRALHNEGATLNRVDQNVATLEVRVVRPGADEVNGSSKGLVVVLGVDVEESNLGNAASGGVIGERGDVENAETGTVVALEGKAIDDELVVIDAVSLAAVVASLLRSLKRSDIPEVGDWVTTSSRTGGINLIVLVVEDEVLLPLGVGDPTLVGVCICYQSLFMLSMRGKISQRTASTLVRGARNDVGLVLVGDIVDGQSVFVVTVADITAEVLLIRATVDEALSIVDVTVTSGATRGGRVGGVAEVNEDQPGAAGAGTRLGADSNGVLLLLVDDDVVGGAGGKAVPVAGKVTGVAEGDRAGGVNVQQLSPTVSIF